MQQEYIYTPLPEPITITEQVWPDGTLPLVCTSTLAYNHEPYIRECLDGILMQKTTFPVQILVHEDCSTDKTAEILKEYQAKYPNLIKVFYQSENVFSLKDPEEKIKRRAEYNSWKIGKYIATCEGDDYWIDPLKLQKQVDFLEVNPEYVLTCHRYKVLDHEKKIWSGDNADKLFKGDIKGFTFDYSIKHWITKTLTLVFRKDALFEYEKYKGLSRDTVLIYFLMKNGLGYCFNDISGVYRLNNGGVCGKQGVRKNTFNAYYVLKDLYKHERNKTTRNMYFSKYASVFALSKGKILFQEKFDIIKIIYLFKYIPIKIYRQLKRL